MILPEPRMYQSWQEWARAMIQAFGRVENSEQTVYFQPCLSTNMPAPVAGGMVYVIDTDTYMKADGTTWVAV